MLLSSVLRLRNYIADQESDLNSSTQNDSILLSWLATVSKRVETYLNRDLEITSRTQYFDTSFNRLRYYVDAPPIVSVTSVKLDSEGQWDGSEATLNTDDYVINVDGQAISLNYPEQYIRDKAVQVVYTGGLAYHGVRSTFVTTLVSGTWTAGKYAIGQASGAVGIVRDITAAAFIVENIYGIFEAGETILEWDSETAIGSSDGNSTISSITKQSLAEAYPDIVRAVEIEIRYMWTHTMDFENIGTQSNGETRRRSQSTFTKVEYSMQPEALALLQPYRRITF